MKNGFFLIALLWAGGAQALPVCASKKAEISKISDLLKKVNLFGTWEGVRDGSPLVAKLYLNTADQIRGEVKSDGKDYGPANVKICDDEGVYYLVVYGQEVEFEVLSRTKIKGYSPFDQNESVVLTKQATLSFDLF